MKKIPRPVIEAPAPESERRTPPEAAESEPGEGEYAQSVGELCRRLVRLNKRRRNQRAAAAGRCRSRIRDVVARILGEGGDGSRGP